MKNGACNLIYMDQIYTKLGNNQDHFVINMREW